LQFAWSRLAEDGTAVLVMPAGAAFSWSAQERAIRQRMIAQGALLGVVALPPNLFPHTAVATHVWVLARDASRLLPPGTGGRMLFIDASRLGSREERSRVVLSPEDVARIGGRLHAWLSAPASGNDEPGFSCSVTNGEVLERGGGLDPRLYVTPPTVGAPVAGHAPERMLDELDTQEALLSASSAGLRNSFTACQRVIGEATGPVPPPTTLGKLAEITLRGSRGSGEARDRLFAGPSGSLIRAKDYVADGEAGVPVVMPRDLTGGGISEAAIKRVPHPLAERLARFHLRPGDVVLARRGELGRCAVVRAEQAHWLCGTGCFVLRPPAELDSDYFAAYLRSPGARAWLEARSTGSLAMKTISREVLGELPVVVPDLRTQRAIAEMTARLDEHEQRLREQLDLTLALRRGTLDELFAD
jgi:type I restriction enzyme M protein